MLGSDFCLNRSEKILNCQVELVETWRDTSELAFDRLRLTME